MQVCQGRGGNPHRKLRLPDSVLHSFCRRRAASAARASTLRAADPPTVRAWAMPSPPLDSVTKTRPPPETIALARLPVPSGPRLRSLSSGWVRAPSPIGVCQTISACSDRTPSPGCMAACTAAGRRASAGSESHPAYSDVAARRVLLHQLHDDRIGQRRHVQHARRWIDGAAAPVRATDIAGDLHRALRSAA